MTPRVSIVTTVYDRVACLRRCLRSVQRSAWDDLEQIVVSDAPPRAVVVEIARIVADAGPRVRHLNLDKRTNNWGIAPAKAGLQASVGEFVCFLSDDNAYLPDHFGPLVAALDADPDLGFVYSSCLYAGRLTLDVAPPEGGRIDLGQPLFRRSVIREHLHDDLPFSQHAWDWALIRTLMERGVRWQHINVPSFIFRLESYPAYMRALA
jgi:glycosyltransferase involved in cell wall biosynthesis